MDGSMLRALLLHLACKREMKAQIAADKTNDIGYISRASGK